jgi:hypothetical protein
MRHDQFEPPLRISKKRPSPSAWHSESRDTLVFSDRRLVPGQSISGIKLRKFSSRRQERQTGMYTSRPGSPQ